MSPRGSALSLTLTYDLPVEEGRSPSGINKVSFYIKLKHVDQAKLKKTSPL